jgi:hypothetical protein
MQTALACLQRAGTAHLTVTMYCNVRFYCACRVIENTVNSFLSFITIQNFGWADVSSAKFNDASLLRPCKLCDHRVCRLLLLKTERVRNVKASRDMMPIQHLTSGSLSVGSRPLSAFEWGAVCRSSRMVNCAKSVPSKPIVFIKLLTYSGLSYLIVFAVVLIGFVDRCFFSYLTVFYQMQRLFSVKLRERKLNISALRPVEFEERRDKLLFVIRLKTEQGSMLPFTSTQPSVMPWAFCPKINKQTH